MVLVSLKLNVRNKKAKDLFASFKVRCVESQTFKLLAMPTLNRRWHSFRLWSTVVLWCAKCCDQARKQSFSSDDSHRPEHAIDLFHAPTQGVSGKFLGRNHVHQQVDNPVAVAPPQHGERNQRTETLISHTLTSNWKCHHDQNILDLFHTTECSNLKQGTRCHTKTQSWRNVSRLSLKVVSKQRDGPVVYPSIKRFECLKPTNTTYRYKKNLNLISRTIVTIKHSIEKIK